MPTGLGSRPTFSCSHPRSSRYISFARQWRIVAEELAPRELHPEVGGEAEVGERLRHLRQAQLRVGGEAYLQAEERGDDPEADDDSFGAGHAQVRGREGQPGVSTPNCLAYSGFEEQWIRDVVALEREGVLSNEKRAVQALVLRLLAGRGHAASAELE